MIREPSSFRDPAGYLFWKDNRIFRAISHDYFQVYRAVSEARFFKSLCEQKKIIGFTEKTPAKFSELPEDISLVLIPEMLPFISYPYEWSFSQLKDAALLTLDLHISALKEGFLLKDASSYNIQFMYGKPVFIDHLSFEKCDKYPIWPAYGQFCRHFLAPLVLMSKVDPCLGKTLQQHIDGIPLSLACKLLPLRRFLAFGLFIHLFCHAKTQKKYAQKDLGDKKLKKLSPFQMLNIARSLRQTVSGLQWKPKGTEWGEYYRITNYSDKAMHHKMSMIAEYVSGIPGVKMLWDFGANTGEMSRCVKQYAANIICFDVDEAAVEKNYLQVKVNRETNILPLVMDFKNPSPSIGFASEERLSLSDRGKTDCGLALALIHHLAITNNLPFRHVAKYFSSLCKYLIIEFVPKEDSQVQRLLQSREDIFPKYDLENFKKEFCIYFEIVQQKTIFDSRRTLFLMKKK